MMSYILIGFALFVFSGICYFISQATGNPEIVLISLGLNALNLFWIMDLQRKVYKKEA